MMSMSTPLFVLSREAHAELDPVSQENFKTLAAQGNLSRLPCGHMFATSDITRWLTEHNSCPTCRATVQSPPATVLLIDQVLRATRIPTAPPPSSCGPFQSDHPQAALRPLTTPPMRAPEPPVHREPPVVRPHPAEGHEKVGCCWRKFSTSCEEFSPCCYNLGWAVSCCYCCCFCCDCCTCDCC